MRIHDILRGKFNVITEAAMPRGVSSPNIIPIHKFLSFKGDAAVKSFSATIEAFRKTLNPDGTIKLDFIQEVLDGQKVALAITQEGEVGVECSGGGVVFDPNRLKSERGAQMLLRYFSQDSVKGKLVSLADECERDIKFFGDLFFIDGKGAAPKSKIVDENGSITFGATSYNADMFGEMGAVVFNEMMFVENGETVAVSAEQSEDAMKWLTKLGSKNGFRVFGSESITTSGSMRVVTKDDKELIQVFEHPEIIDDMATKKRSGVEFQNKNTAIAAREQLIRNLGMTFDGERESNLVENGASVKGLTFDVNGVKFFLQNTKWETQQENVSVFVQGFESIIDRFFRDVCGVRSKSAALQKFIEATPEEMEEVAEQYRSVLPDFKIALAEALEAFENDTKVMPKAYKLSKANELTHLFRSFNALTDDIESLKELVVGKPVNAADIQHNGRTNYAIIPGSFKPPHKGHYDMVEKYSRMVGESGFVMIVVSDPQDKASQRIVPATGQPITGEQSKQIWEIYCKNLPNVEIVVSQESPLVAANNFGYSIEEPEKSAVIFGCSTKGDDIKRYAQMQLSYRRRFPMLLAYNALSTAVEPLSGMSGNISATDFRAVLGDEEAMKQFMPDHLTTEDIDQVLDILQVQDVEEQNLESALTEE